MVSVFLQFLENNFLKQLEKPKSSLGYQYPTLRDHPLHSVQIWLQGKQADDGAEGLWRLYDNLYDFTEFIKNHPGGSEWLELTKGIDITEIFEAHHISTKPEKLLHKYFVREAQTPRNSPFTFEENGFYRTLKKRVRKELENIPKHPERRSKFLADIMFFIFMLTSLIAVKEQSYVAATISGVFLTMVSIAAHNFFHQRDNLRMHYFNFALMSTRDWRVSHALSHHIFTNTIYDLEISSLEPFLQYMPTKKNLLARYGSWLYSPMFYASFYFSQYLKTIIQAVINKAPPRWENYIPLLHIVLLYHWGGNSFATTLLFYVFIETVASFFFGAIGLNAGHHHPDVFHDGDAARCPSKMDWGLHQMDAVMDRVESTGSHFLVLISFGDHALHHLFPTIDHGRLNYLYPVLEDVCKEFNMNIRMKTQWNLMCGQFQQLAKTKPSEKE